MKTNWNLDEKSFISHHVLLLAQSMIEENKGALDRDLLRKTIRLMDKFTPNAAHVNLKLWELELLQQIITRVEHEIENRVVPSIEKSENVEKETQLVRAKELLSQIAELTKKLETYIRRSNEFRIKK